MNTFREHCGRDGGAGDTDRGDDRPPLPAGPSLRWRALVRGYFHGRRQGLDAPAALTVAWAALGVTPEGRPVVPTGREQL